MPVLASKSRFRLEDIHTLEDALPFIITTEGSFADIGRQVLVEFTKAQARYSKEGNTRNEKTMVEQKARFEEWARRVKLFSEGEDSLDGQCAGKPKLITVMNGRLTFLLNDLKWLNSETAEDMYADPKFDVPLLGTDDPRFENGRKMREVVETRLIAVPQHVANLDYMRKGALRYDGSN
ncbi:hypothetical protein BJY01DRAFT_247298 [Aspergillus pseudoustus]|uniref:Uncharacterized protein n=1 Tax=Aspergillus pseudoustus TaxID=1810923 RepID=A0ABR4K2F2_9EURO